MKERGKIKNVLSVVLFAVTFLLCGLEVKASGLYSNMDAPFPMVKWTDDDYAWTFHYEGYTAWYENTWTGEFRERTDEELQRFFWYPEDYEILTGIPLNLPEAGVGQHLYEYERKGVIPLYKWFVQHRGARCVHVGSETNWHGIGVRDIACTRPYWSGWQAICADCGERYSDYNIYAREDDLRRVGFLDNRVEYYFQCPYVDCGHLEQQSGLDAHMCKSVSYNMYRVEYKPNCPKGQYNGSKSDTYHMYNNATEYNGIPVIPNTHLSLNVEGDGYFRDGYKVVGWSYTPGGEMVFEDGEEIFNLTEYDYNIDEVRGTITLYAVWEKVEGTLIIDPNGGKYYDGNSEDCIYNPVDGLSTIKGVYGDVYNIDISGLEPPKGFTVSYDTKGGEPEDADVTINTFMGWEMSYPFYGTFLEEKQRYGFTCLTDGWEDRLTALWLGSDVTLPTPKREGYSFCGWYKDEECVKYPVGGGGTTITPTGDMTLYAKWVNAELILHSKVDLTVDDGKGGVDLRWEQDDEYLKSYKIYQKKEGTTEWVHLFDASGTVNDLAEKKYFGFAVNAQTFVAPYAGFYTLEAEGAQGGNYGTYKGGRGGYARMKVWLDRGERLTMTIGAQNGTNGGGKAEIRDGVKNGANGGGRTTITSNKKGLLLMVGGGGGASKYSPGLNGGVLEGTAAIEGVISGYTGESGVAGGGGGYRSGVAGEYVLHEHKDTCYKTIDPYVFTKFNDITTWLNFVSYTRKSEISERDGVKVSGHTDSDVENIYMYVGRGGSDSDPVTPIPTNGNTKLTIPFYFYSWGEDGHIMDGAFLYVYDQNKDVIKYFDMADQYTSKSYDASKYTYHYWIDKNFEVTLPEGTTGVYMALFLPVYGGDPNNALRDEGSWVEVQMKPLSFTGGGKVLTCTKGDDYVESSTAANGGTTYINPEYAITQNYKKGVVTGNGTVMIYYTDVGYLNACELHNVSANDEAAPDKIDETLLTITPDANREVLVEFVKPADNGTLYFHRAESYDIRTGSKLATSNDCQDVITTQVKGYYLILDKKTETVVTADNYIGMEKQKPDKRTAWVNVELQEYEQYLHLAPVDNAGNVGDTIHVRIPSIGDFPWAWDVSTEQIAVSSVVGPKDFGSVYKSPAAEKTYYVKADGTTPFNLSYGSKLGGMARVDYQVDTQAFDIRIDGESMTQWFKTKLPLSDSTLPGSVLLDAGKFTRSTSGNTILKDAMYSTAARTDKAVKNSFSQAFTGEAALSGKTAVVTPRAGACYVNDKGQKDIKWSDATLDAANSVSLILDGEGPVISGTDILDDLDWIGKDEGSVCLQISATDDLSGVKELKVVIANRDNHSTREYFPDENGVLTLNITKDEVIFNGDFGVTISATDFVGNKTQKKYEITELALTAEVKRILQPHEPIFKSGESGILTITAWGYVERIEVEFPEEFVRWNQELNKVYYYTDASQYRREESLQFMVPLGVLANQRYTITVRAYKGDKMLEEYPALSTVENGGSVLDELRTRLR